MTYNKHKHKPIEYEKGQATTIEGCLDIDKNKLSNLIADAIEKINKIENDTNPLIGNLENLIDPIGASIEIATIYGNNRENWAVSEQARSKQKTIMNIVGNLQQSFIGCLPNWTSNPTGSSSPDIVGKLKFGEEEISIIGEVKNKHNTLNHDSRKNIIKKMQDFTKNGYKDAVPIVVHIVKQAYKNDGKLLQFWSSSNNVHFMSGRIFYAIAANPIIDYNIFSLPHDHAKNIKEFKNIKTINSFDCINEYIFHAIQDSVGTKFDYDILEYIKNQKM